MVEYKVKGRREELGLVREEKRRREEPRCLGILSMDRNIFPTFLIQK